MDPRALFQTMVGKLNGWELSPRSLAVGLVIAQESFAQGLMEVELWQRELALLSGYSETCVSRAIEDLETKGVLQRRGRRGGTRIFRLLPNAELLEPARCYDEAAARGVRAAVRLRNGARVDGDDPGGVPLLIRPAGEELSADLARGSAARAAEDAADEAAEGDAARAELRRKCAESLGVKLPARQVADPGNLSAWQVGTLAIAGGARDVRDVSRAAPNVSREDVSDARLAEPPRPAGCGGGDADFAFEQIRALLPRREFEQWERKWRTRCRTEPAAILEAIGDAKLYGQRNKVSSIGALIFRRAAAICRDAGRELRSIFFA